MATIVAVIRGRPSRTAYCRAGAGVLASRARAPGGVRPDTWAAAWYLPEAFAAAARLWQARLLEGRVRLIVPSLHYWELANVLRTYVRRAELDAGLAAEIYALHLEAPLEVVEPKRTDVLKTALELDATAYDAVFITLSRSLGVPLLTAERKTTPWVARMGRLVQTVRG